MSPMRAICSTNLTLLDFMNLQDVKLLIMRFPPASLRGTSIQRITLKLNLHKQILGLQSEMDWLRTGPYTVPP
jgi:hypothetical protein